MRRFNCVIGALLLLGICERAQASPIAYQESISGDLNGSQNFALDIGINTIGGAVCLGDPGQQPFCFDLDSFSASIPADARVTDISLTYVLTAPMPSSVTWLLQGPYFAGPFLMLYADALTANQPGSHEVSFSNLPSTLTGTLTIQSLPFLIFGTTLDYTWRLTVASQAPEVPVPEPTVMLLYGTGLAAIALRRAYRRKQR